MSLSAAMIDALVAAGGTIEQLAAMVKADMDEQAARKAEKREGNAERQRRFKARRRGNRGNALPSVTPPIEEIIPPVPSNEETTPQAAERPEGVSEQVFSDFVKLRKAQRAPVTRTALAGIASEAAKAGWTLEAAMSEQVSRGWRGFKADWVNAAKPPGAMNDDLAARILKRQAAESTA